jgi:hypothetical protein
MDTASTKPRHKFSPHGYLGILIIAVAEVLLFSGNRLVGHWFTPIVWTGYILFVDALVYKFKGRSPLVNDRREFVIVALVSVAGWWLFEWYNAPRFWKSDLELWWHYHSLEPNLFLRRAGYDWAFATISPAMFETAELLTITAFARQQEKISIKFSKAILVVLILLGAIGVVVPLVLPSEWFAPVIWLSFVLFLDPLNALRGQPSITGDLARGDWRRLWALLAAGLICGVLWEFWNFWALSKWTYTVPFFGDLKLFEMPVLGYLGFPPFAIECWALYIFIRSLLNSGATPTADGEVFLKSY